MTSSAPVTSPGRAAVRRTPVARVALMALAGLCLLVGLDAGLMLLGAPTPVRTQRLPDVHGMLLVFGFVGTLVSVERAVALRDRRGFLAPALLGVGGLLLVSPAPLALGQWVLLAGAAALVAVYVPLWRRQHDEAVLVQAFAAVLGFAGLLLWRSGVPVIDLLPWPAAFIVLTIAGERLELARLAMGASAGTRLVQLTSAVTAGVVASLLWPGTGHVLLGVSMLVLVAWLAHHDVARRTVHAEGITRFMAIAMLAGYGWLGVAGATWAVTGPTGDGAAYDVVVHAVFLGFTLSMIIAHAPVILPAVLGRALPYRPLMYLPLGLLHGSLLLRLWVGDARGSEAALEVGGVLDVVAVLGFAGVAVWSALRGTAR
ncbi:MAG TPA: hypothetical protein VFE07_08805 [Marmoricola sp.]|jgi:hypothetical protein|nr:hypothetical protein [Marmoricola sp.]